MKTLFLWMIKEMVLVAAWVLAVCTAFFIPPDLAYLNYIDYHTLGLLLCLMAVMAGLQGLGIFQKLGESLLKRVKTTRQLAVSYTHLYIRYGEKTGEVMVCLVVNGNGLKGEQELVRMLRETVPGLKSVVVNHNRERTNVILGKKCRTIWGQDFITDVYKRQVGDGPEAEPLSVWAHDLKISSQVSFIGTVPHEKMPEYYAVSDVFVSASQHDLMSIAALEAVACGLPTLLPHDKWDASQVKEGVSGFSYRSAREFGEYLKKFASLSPHRRQILKRVVRSSIQDLSLIHI